MDDLHISVPWPVTIAQDNTACIILANSGHFNPRTRHIAIRYLYVNELVNEGVVSLRYVRTTEMSADVLTKALATTEHRKHINVLFGYTDVCLDAEDSEQTRENEARR